MGLYCIALSVINRNQTQKTTYRDLATFTDCPSVIGKSNIEKIIILN